MAEKNSDAVFTVLDYLLLIIENLLAIRVVFSYLGAKQTIIHSISNIILFPFAPLVNRLTFISDTSVLDVFSAILVIILFYLHKIIDRKNASLLSEVK
ncbi:MAG: hypothetical protein N2440_06310 [Actinobacteria bacterium]|nr:hypothetical protein [Actinomycetota bacterium]